MFIKILLNNTNLKFYNLTSTGSIIFSIRFVFWYFIKAFSSIPERITVESYPWYFKIFILHSAKECNRTAIDSIESAEITGQEKYERSDNISICNPSRGPFQKVKKCQSIYNLIFFKKNFFQFIFLKPISNFASYQKKLKVYN